VKKLGIVIAVGGTVFAVWYAARQADGFGAGLKRLNPAVYLGITGGVLLAVLA